MQNLTPLQMFEHRIAILRNMVTNLMLDNKNFRPQDGEHPNSKPGFYVETYPRTAQFIAGPLKSMASYILDDIDLLKSVGSALVDVGAVAEASDERLIAELVKRGYTVSTKAA